MTIPDRAYLRKLAENATPGPWEAVGTGVSGGDHWYVCADHEAIMSVSSQDGSNEDERQPLAEFIAAARTAVPSLLDENAELRTRIQAVRDMHNANGVRWVGFPRADEQVTYCTYCQERSPCTTIRTLDT